MVCPASARECRVSPQVIVVLEERPLMVFAARELQRYIQLRTGKLLPMAKNVPADKPFILVKRVAGLGGQEYGLHAFENGLEIGGGSDLAVLYGAYRFAEHLGVRFYLHGDVIPDRRIALDVSGMEERGAPLFERRGILPFHDFTEGPDWWSLDDYKNVIAQMVKMRMNWMGFHCYPESGIGPEPLVWIGLPEDVNEDGTVKWAYRSRWQSTFGGTWGYAPAKTSEFAAGAGLLFPGDDFGSPVTDGLRPWPKTPQESAELFNRSGRLIAQAFGLAERLGVMTVVGTETPLTIPKTLRKRMKKKGMDPTSPESVEKVYRGMFLRIKRLHALGAYWVWTPEKWTWSGNSREQLDVVLADFKAATTALDEVENPFVFGTCGWVLGPSQDRSLFDKTLPSDAVMACISRNLGFAPLEPGLLDIGNRPKWAIPWLEDDHAMTQPQLWVGRTRRDAADAYAYGCTGLMGIQWRTKIIAPNVAALAAAAWDQSGWNPGMERKTNATHKIPNDFRMGGRGASCKSSIAGTENDAPYRSCRYDMDGYRIQVPNGTYEVTLRFCVIACDRPGKRVFDVAGQGKKVAEQLDVFARAGKNSAYDITVPGVKVVDEKLRIKFQRRVGFPFVAAIEIEGHTARSNQIASKPFSRKINCGNKPIPGYESDLADIGRDAAPGVGDLPRDLPVEDFYRDWCRANFGENVADELAAIFTKLDGASGKSYTKKQTRLPRPAIWIGGPGSIAPNKTPWSGEKARYVFVDALAELRPEIKGAGNLARFDYWLNSFRYLQAMGKAGCTRGALDKAVEAIDAATGDGEKRSAAEKALSLRIRLARDWEEMMRFQLAAVDTVGGMGTIANLEQHVRRCPALEGKKRFLAPYDKELENVLGRPLPQAARPTTTYLGKPRLIVPSPRSVRLPGEVLNVRAIVLDAESTQKPLLEWRALGGKNWKKIAPEHLGRSVWRFRLPETNEQSIEYRITATGSDGTKLQWPALYPQTVVVLPND